MKIFEYKERTIFLLTVIFCAGLLVSAFLLQYFVRLIPCSLCIVQRFFYFLVGLTALSAFFGWIKDVSTRAYGGLMLLFALLGGAVAVRQVWLQYFFQGGDPTKCLIPGGSFLNSVILSLGGTGSCAIRDFTLIGLSLAEWSSLCFLFLGAVSVGIILGLFSSRAGEVE